MNNDPLHILLADDDEDDRYLFTEAFSGLKVETIVHTVNDGVQLMEWLNRIDIRLPYLLFLDLNMPRKNGVECLQEIRSNEKFKNIFIAIYSTSDNERDIEETFLKGANIYIIKPDDYKRLKQFLEKAVNTVLQYQGQSIKREDFLLKI